MSKERSIPIAFTDNGIDGRIVIDLTLGHFASFDIIDKDLVRHKWIASVTGNNVYAIRRDPTNRKTILMHREVMERILGRPLLPNEKIDHKDGFGTNNQRNNLQLADASQNAANTRKKIRNNDGKTPSSRYKGVSFIEERQKWYAQISCKGKKKNLGHYDSEEEAARVWDKAAISIYGNRIKLNLSYEDYVTPEHRQNGIAMRKPKPPTIDNNGIK